MAFGGTRHVVGAAVAALAAGLAAPVWAQTGSPPVPSSTTPDPAPATTVVPATAANAATQPEARPGEALTDIVVTAQRRGENLQDTPLSVSAITGDLAVQKGVFGTSDLQAVTPGLVFADSGVGPAVYLRGIGTQNTAGGDEGSISTYVDGVYYSNLPSAFASLANVERVEVLKGPQGTLFGRNATGGLISVITRDPSFDTSFNGSLTYGTYNTYGGDFYVTGPVTDSVAANLSAFMSNQTDGWGKNIVNGRDVYDARDYALRSKILWNIGPDTQAILNADYSYRTDSSTSGAVDRGAVGAGGNAGLDNFYDIEASLQPLDRNTTGGVSLRVQHDFSFARLSSITAWRFNKLTSQFDNDRSRLVIADGFFRTDDKQFTQELQIQSLPESRVNWIGGLYYLNNKTDLKRFRLVGLAFNAIGGSVNVPARQNTDSYSAYAQATVPIVGGLNATAGVRYTKDQREITSRTILGTGTTIQGLDQESDFSKVTYRAALDYHVNDDVMVFASYNRGFKSGVFNMYAPNAPAINPEVLDAFEVGLKSEFFDKRLRFNVAPFLYKYKDIQLVVPILTGTRLLNAARATLKGVDIEATAVVMRGLTLDASAEFLDSRYDSFPNAPLTLPRPATCGTAPAPGTPPATLPGPRTGGNITCTIDASGFQLIRAPKFSGTIGATYAWTTAAGDFRINANVFHSATFPYEPNGRLRQRSYQLLNAQIAWTEPTGRYGVTIFGRNLLDQEYFVNHIGGGGGDTFVPAAPLTAGVSFNIKL